MVLDFRLYESRLEAISEQYDIDDIVSDDEDEINTYLAKKILDDLKEVEFVEKKSACEIEIISGEFQLDESRHHDHELNESLGHLYMGIFKVKKNNQYITGANHIYLSYDKIKQNNNHKIKVNRFFLPWRRESLEEVEWHCNHTNNIKQLFEPDQETEKELGDLIDQLRGK